MSVTIVDGDLLETDATFLAHQCNCVTNKAAHLSAAVFNQFPYADVYTCRGESKKRDRPGTIALRGDGKGERFVVNMFAQRYPGKSKWSNDTYDKRKEWLTSCLKAVVTLPEVKTARAAGSASIAFPYNMGCGAAGGEWEEYEAIIRAFAEASGLDVTLYKFTPPQTSSSPFSFGQHLTSSTSISTTSSSSTSKKRPWGDSTNYRPSSNTYSSSSGSSKYSKRSKPSQYQQRATPAVEHGGTPPSSPKGPKPSFSFF